tara:strand:+ start:1261 stop:1494 length:234 start_codon:yes stop_codon:yes gene_type:complete
VIVTSSGCNTSQALPLPELGLSGSGAKLADGSSPDAGEFLDAAPDCELKLQVEEVERINQELEEIRKQLKEQVKNGE